MNGNLNSICAFLISVESRKGPIQPWEPYLCQTVSKCADIDDIDLFVKGSIHESLKYVPKSKQTRKSTQPNRSQKDKTLGNNVEIYAKLKQEHNNKGKPLHVLVEEPENVKRGDGSSGKDVSDTGRITPAHSSVDGNSGTDGARATSSTSVESRKGRPGSNTKPDTPRSKTKRLLVLSQTYNQNAQNGGEAGSAGHLSASDSRENILKSKSSSSGSSLGADDRKQERERQMPKLSYTQSNIKLKPVDTLQHSPMRNSGSRSRVKDDDEDNYNEFVRSDHRGRCDDTDAPSGRDSASSRPKAGMMVTAISELKERCESRVDSNLLDVESRSQPSSTSDEDGLGKFRTPSSMTPGPPDSAMSNYSGRSEGDSRKTAKQYTLALNKVDLVRDTEEDDSEYVDGQLSARHAQSLPPPSSDHTPPPSASLTLSNQPSELNSRATSRKTRSESARSPLSNHLFPIGELLPAVDKSLKTTMTGYKGTRMQESLKKEQTTIAGLEQEIALTSRDKLLPYEDTIIMMREGVELVRLRERQQTVSSSVYHCIYIGL